jgi:1D-myo-inositol-triphosphate 3-kinase
LRGVTPAYLREVQYKGQTFIELQDLLHGFRDPHVMDVKMGTRTFLESEVQHAAARHDLYLKVSLLLRFALLRSFHLFFHKLNF